MEPVADGVGAAFVSLFNFFGTCLFLWVLFLLFVLPCVISLTGMLAEAVKKRNDPKLWRGCAGLLVFTVMFAGATLRLAQYGREHVKVTADNPETAARMETSIKKANSESCSSYACSAECFRGGLEALKSLIPGFSRKAQPAS